MTKQRYKTSYFGNNGHSVGTVYIINQTLVNNQDSLFDWVTYS